MARLQLSLILLRLYKLGWVLKDSQLFILFAENSQILLKISVIPILLTGSSLSDSINNHCYQVNDCSNKILLINAVLPDRYMKVNENNRNFEKDLAIFCK